jgi:predicted NBD/HSP70 family sugar kinase
MLGLKVQDNAEFGAEIIRKVRDHEALSRVELARVLGVAASTIGRHVDALIAAGYFTETLEPTREAGRPPTKLRPNPTRGCFLGVDFYAEQMFATLVDFAQQTVAQRKMNLDGEKGAEVMMTQLLGALREMRDSTTLPLLAVGLAVPGRVDTRRGIGLKYVHVPGWDNIPVTETTTRVLGAPAFVENNIRTMALAERWFGEGRGSTELICLGVRHGVAAGVIRDGQLATGHQELGGEIRGWNCPVYNSIENKWEWRPGQVLEKHANVGAVLKRDAELRGKALPFDEWVEAVKNGDKHAMTALREIAAIHGWVVSQMAQLIDPEMVVLAGPMAVLGDLYLTEVNNTAVQFESDFLPSVTIRLSELGEYGGAVGAAALALERWRPADVG